ncbi:hypothetical protein JIX56_17265 [Streptomyces sp. CA-210063]|nr:hypothetical protein [Streptomyces sp. CA-210063]UUU31515.1 hypothetical protein JIX56_17265 [Streptomyces sp. CA-210063]
MAALVERPAADLLEDSITFLLLGGPCGGKFLAVRAAHLTRRS